MRRKSHTALVAATPALRSLSTYRSILPPCESSTWPSTPKRARAKRSGHAGEVVMLSRKTPRRVIDNSCALVFRGVLRACAP